MAAGGDPPALVLIDVQLPDLRALDVVQLLKSHAKTRKVPIVAFHVRDPRVGHAAAAAGCAACLGKPIDADRLQEVLMKPAPHS